jgi:D-3-phosphoglycerate dehydrogenase
MGRYSVLILDAVFESYAAEERVLTSLSTDIVTYSDNDRDEIRRLARDIDGLLANLHQVDADLIESMQNCRIISRYGVGIDNVDIDAATKAGIWVTNVPDYATEDVSDHAVALLMACIRKIPLRDASIRKGEWNLKERQQSRRAAGKTMGLLGLGNIGGATARKLSGFGFARVLACDPYVDDDDFSKAGVESVGIETLLEESDLLSLHLPLNDQTRHIINGQALRRMKKSAIIVNTARGGIVDTDALVDALRTGEIEYAGLDVHEAEPLPLNSPLLELENVVLTDHCGWYTEESLIELKTRAAENVADVLGGGRPRSPVNDPGL